MNERKKDRKKERKKEREKERKREREREINHYSNTKTDQNNYTWTTKLGRLTPVSLGIT
jgi:hypothetical protein